MKTSAKFDQEVGQRLELVRVALGFKSQAEFAEAFGANKSQYNNWVKAANGMPPYAAVRLRAQFGVSLDYIYCGDASSLPFKLAKEIEGLASSPT